MAFSGNAHRHNNVTERLTFTETQNVYTKNDLNLRL